ncbi:MAG TPA: DUF3616 domain-containing protein [Candidatus Obscuribacterales bacterium]
MSDSPCALQFAVNPDLVRTSLSAVRHIGPHLWLGCDESATLERLTYHGEYADEHHHFSISEYLPLPSTNDEEIDIEGIAYADHYLWFVGSHSLKRKSYKPDQDLDTNLDRLQTIKCEDNRYTLGRIPLVNGQLHRTCPHPEQPAVTLTAAQLKRKKSGNELTHALKKDPYLGAFLAAGIPGKDNGFDIEGIAIMGDRLWLGLRGPVLRGWAVMVELQLQEADPGILKLQKIGASKQRYRLHFCDLEGLGIRDLCPWQDQLLILAGPTMTLEGPVKIFALPLQALQAGHQLLEPLPLMTIPSGPDGDRPEGLTLLDTETGTALVVFDGPTAQRLQGDQGVLSDRIHLPSPPH